MKKLLIAILFINMAQAQNEITVQRLDGLPFTYHIYSVDLPSDFSYQRNRHAISSGRDTFSFNGNIFTDNGHDYDMSPEFSDQINQIFNDASVGYGYAINEERRRLNDIVPIPFDPFSEFRNIDGWSIAPIGLGPIPDNNTNVVLQYDDIYSTYLIIGGDYEEQFPVVAPETHIQVQQRIIVWWNDPANHPNG